MVEIEASQVSWIIYFLWLWIKWIIQWVDIFLSVTTLDFTSSSPWGPIYWQGITGRRAGISFSKQRFEMEVLHASQREVHPPVKWCQEMRLDRSMGQSDINSVSKYVSPVNMFIVSPVLLKARKRVFFLPKEIETSLTQKKI